MKNFRTFDLAVKFYRSTQTLRLKGDSRDQLSRAARSISLNLAEGRGRNSNRDQLRFFHIALGSLRECEAILILEDLKKTESFDLANQLGACLYRLTEHIKDRL